MGVIAQRLAARQAKAVGDPGNDFGGSLSILGSGSAISARTTEQLLGATSTSTWPRLATQLKAIRMGQTAWTLLRPGPRSSFRADHEYRIHKSRLERPIADAPAVGDRQSYIASLKASGFIVEQVDHPFLEMYDRGTMWSDNPRLQFPGTEVARWMNTTYESVGEWYLALVRDSTGIPVNWLPIPPHWVTPPRLPGQPNYQVSRLGLVDAKGVPPQDMAVYRQAASAEPFDRGAGDMNATDVETRIDELASTHLASRLQNHGVPLLLMVLAGMTEPEKKAFEHEWTRDLTGPLKAGMTKFLKAPEAFDLKTGLFLKELQASVADLEIAQLRGHSRDASLMGNRVPPLAAGEQRSGNRAMATVAFKLLEENAILPARESQRGWMNARFFRPVGSRPAEYEGGWIVMWQSREVTDEGSRDRMMAQVPGHFSRAQFLRVAGAQPKPGDDDLYVISNNQVVYNAATNQVVFEPPQPQGGTPFGADIETPVAKFEDQLVVLASLADRMEFGMAEQGE